MCNIKNRIKKVQACANQIANTYIEVDLKLKILKPLVYDPDFIKPFNNTVAANALEILRITLLLDLIRVLVGMTQDKDKRTASLATVVEQIGELTENFCVEKDRKEKFKTVEEKQKQLVESDLGNKLKKVRDKIVSHNEMNLKLGENRYKACKPEDFCLYWNDAEKYMNDAEPIIFEIQYLVSREICDLEQIKKDNSKIAQDFWDIFKQNSRQEKHL